MIEFAESPVPIKVASRVLGMRPETIRDRMAEGSLDIGIIHIPVKRRYGNKRRRAAYISPKKLYELTGYIWSKEKEKEYEKDKQCN